MEESGYQNTTELIRDKLSEGALKLFDVFGREWLTKAIIADRKNDNTTRYAASISQGREDVPDEDSLRQVIESQIYLFDEIDELKEKVTLSDVERLDLIDKIYDFKEDSYVLKEEI